MGYRELCSIKTVLFVAWGGAYTGFVASLNESYGAALPIEASSPPAAAF